MTIHAPAVKRLIRETFRIAVGNATVPPPPEFETLKALPYYRQHFTILSEQQTEKFGQHTARFLSDLKPEIAPRRRVRFGICGTQSVGKTSLIKSLVTELGEPQVILSYGIIMKHFSTRAGLVIHCDSGHERSEINGLPLNVQEAGIDIYEHPEGAPDPDFDVLMNFEHDDFWEIKTRAERKRFMTVLTDDRIATTDAFQNFCASLEEFHVA